MISRCVEELGIRQDRFQKQDSQTSLTEQEGPGVHRCGVQETVTGDTADYKAWPGCFLRPLLLRPTCGGCVGGGRGGSFTSVALATANSPLGSEGLQAKLRFWTGPSPEEQISAFWLLALRRPFLPPLRYIWWKFQSDKEELYLKPVRLYFKNCV